MSGSQVGFFSFSLFGGTGFPGGTSMSGGAHRFFDFPGDQCQLIRWSLGVSTPSSQPHFKLLMGLHLIRVIDPCS